MYLTSIIVLLTLTSDAIFIKPEAFVADTLLTPITGRLTHLLAPSIVLTALPTACLVS